MAHSRTAKKAIRQNKKRRAHNRAVSRAMRTQIKRVGMAVEANDGATARNELANAQKALDKAAKSNRIHANKAGRLKSQLAKAVAGLSAQG